MSEKKWGWDDEVDQTEKPRVMLPEGPALFAVTELKRSHRAMGKLGECNVADLKLMITTEVQEMDPVEMEVSLPLVESMKWKVLQFFAAIGQRKRGDTGNFRPDWTKVDGSTGKCEIYHREYTSASEKKKAEAEKRDPVPMKVIDIKEFVETVQADALKFD